jgi:hypothetical protein
MLEFLGLPPKVFEKVNANEFRMPKTYVKWFYSSYYLRKIYGFIVPDFIRKKTKKFIHNTKKPSVNLDKDNLELIELVKDYQATREKVACVS